MVTTTYQNNILAPNGGVNPFAGVGQRYDFTLALTGPNAEVTVILTDTNTGIQYQLGFGFVSGQQPVFSFTYNNKVYTLAGATTYFSAINDPITWNNPSGNFNGFVTMSDYFATQADLISLAAYQGRLAFFSNYTVQFWIIDPNPVNWQQAQVLTNIGTFASRSVSSLGDLDVLFLGYMGIRSLRVRETTFNAYVNDIGSPIDTLIQTTLTQSGITHTRNSCSVTDPNTGRYWLFIPNTHDVNGVGKIYVLSYYPSNKIIAWSTYDPSYIVNGIVTYFTPTWFVVFHGQVYARSAEGDLFVHGDYNGSTFDIVPATIQVPYFDMEHPAHIKKAQAIDVDVTGTWTIKATGDWITGTLENVDVVGKATFDRGFVPWSYEGTHFSIQMVSTDASAAVVSSLILHYSLGNQPVK